MDVIESTKEIILLTLLDKAIDKKWINWAIDMLCNGIETDNLYILAGETEPMNQFEAKKLVLNIFDELKIDYSNKDKIIKDYVLYLIQKVYNNELGKYEMLNKIYLLDNEINQNKVYLGILLNYIGLKMILKYIMKNFHYHGKMV
jgi:hypothetical protein